ncbi:hypothetical protein HK098_003202 [Nowakowskiella sp. JEL0407]|nr:hypothetical protein HK098_003202 [Nowakowskiella sp. JEL0407]
MSVPTNSTTSDLPTITLTLSQYQDHSIHSCIFGALVLWSLYVLKRSYTLWFPVGRRQKPIYILCLLQSIFYFWKITAATLYYILTDLDCSARAPVIIVPNVIAWQLIYVILLIKLLLFTPFRQFAKGFFALALIAQFTCVIYGTVMRKDGRDKTGSCSTTYPIVFKQQYIIELVIEIVTAVLLLHGLSYKTSNLLEGTREIFRQLRNNEQSRIFLIAIFISLKIFFTYVPLPFSSISLTHGVDSCRSALVCWALENEQRKVANGTRGGRGSVAKNAQKTSVASRVESVEEWETGKRLVRFSKNGK